MSAVADLPRNSGPSWGFGFLLWAERDWPRWIFRPVLMFGTWVALPLLPKARRHSRDFLTVVLGRPPRLLDVWRHLFAFTEVLVLKLRVGRGGAHTCRLDPTLGVVAHFVRGSE